ncbi:hypothetical protein [Salinimicrobium oceani]|uniref:Uncharacterized protein n=1 Tax=Salinimicrobium oceani TaxID=2722702 RepID=A0ABX1CWD0_9FLAO|nr:hypothetical protein [Salinimicrobium oceani]NJW52057.1 hypothetical protein [Salinimicrobium oceani]
MKTFGKYLLLLFAFLNLSEATAFNFTADEVKEELPLSSESFKAVHSNLFASRENPFQEISDFSERAFSATSSVDLTGIRLDVHTLPAFAFLIRDLRKSIAQYLFPKHFFL